ncbi:MAG TPA: GGDEF domain-containing protein [Beijerinckiaceae bacterium]
MSVDFATLTAAGGLVGVVSGLLLLFAWTQYDDGKAALALAASHLAGAGAILLLAVDGPDGLAPTLLAQQMFVASAGLALASAFVFGGARGGRAIALLVVVVCLVVAAARLLFDAPGAARAAQLAASGPLFLATAALHRARADAFAARTPLVCLFAVHGAMTTIGLIEAVAHELRSAALPSFSDWFGLIHLESMIYFIGTSMLMVALLKERSEQTHKVAALTDPLTGLPNRRAFFYECDRLIDRRRGSGAPLTLLVIDLDRFKAINDTFGHGVGDRVLQVFAEVARSHVRPGDVMGRLGGEEFAVLMPQTGAQEAEEVAQRIRRGFAAAADEVDGARIRGTLSAGLAVLFGPQMSLDAGLERADAALYRAKLKGRDRVEHDAGAPNMRLVPPGRIA